MAESQKSINAVQLENLEIVEEEELDKKMCIYVEIWLFIELKYTLLCCFGQNQGNT